MKKEVIKISGMHCMHCVNNVKQALLQAGAETVDVSLEQANATITFNQDQTVDAFISAIEELGFDVVE